MYAALPILRCKKIKTIYTYGEGGNPATRKEGGCTMSAASNAVMPKDIPRPTPMRHKRKGLAGGVQWKGDWADGIFG